MKSAELIAELKRRRHAAVYHACTLGSFRSYAEVGAYRSRDAVVARRLTLTPQVSDGKDKELGVWNHLFLNVFDQHGDVHKGKSVTGINKYGPVLMVFSVDGMAAHRAGILGCRKEISAPDYDPREHDVATLADFVAMTFADRNPQSFSDAPSRIPDGRPGPNMCVHYVDDTEGIPFGPYLTDVIVDTLPEPFSSIQTAVLHEVQALTRACAPNATVRLRSCIPTCYCRAGYATMSERDVSDFFYTTNAHVYGMPRRRLRGIKG